MLGRKKTPSDAIVLQDMVPTVFHFIFLRTFLGHICHSKGIYLTKYNLKSKEKRTRVNNQYKCNNVLKHHTKTQGNDII